MNEEAPLSRETHRSYSDLLKDPRWFAFVERVKEAKKGSCDVCVSEENLQVHHLGYRPVAPWEYQMHEVQLLCRACHLDVHIFADELWNECLKITNKWAIYECRKRLKDYIENELNPTNQPLQLMKLNFNGQFCRFENEA